MGFLGALSAFSAAPRLANGCATPRALACAKRRQREQAHGHSCYVDTRTTAQAKPVRRKCDGDCWLCSLEPGDKLLLQLREVRAQGRMPDAKRLALYEKELGRDKRPEVKTVTPELVRNHLAYHGHAAPTVNRNVLLRKLDGLRLTEKDRALLLLIGRARRVTAEQIAQTFHSQSGRTEKQMRWAAQRQLRKLERWDLITRVPDILCRPEQVTGKRANVYILAKGGQLLLGPDCALSKPEDIKWQHKHDLALTDVLLKLHEGDTAVIGNHEVEVGLRLANCWTARPLDMAVRYRSHVVGETHYSAVDTFIRPDGFAALSVSSDSDSVLSSFLLPLFIELDTGSQEATVVGQQIANYVQLAVSGAVGKRFPDLAVDGYSPPMVMVFDRAQNRWLSIGSRFRQLRAAVAAEFKRRGYKLDKLPGLFLVERPAFLTEGIHTPAWDMRAPEQQEDERRALVLELLAASRALVEANRLQADDVLSLDLQAVPRAVGVSAKIENAKERALSDAETERHEQALVQLREQMADDEQRRQAALGKDEL